MNIRRASAVKSLELAESQFLKRLVVPAPLSLAFTKILCLNSSLEV